MKTNLYPMTFNPVYKDYPWGGTRILKTFNRKEPEGIYAESWDISDHTDGMSVISNGPLAGKTLRQILQDSPKEIMGTSVEGTRFPLLIKLIDSKQKLSIQVHPSDQTVAQFGGEAKTEMWYLMSKKPTQVYCGFNEGVTKERFKESIEKGTSEEMVRTIPVKKDSVVLVRGGTVHAIDKGCLILEIQQNSNTTYRTYDWGRVDKDGKSRDLHIDQAFNVINWNDDYNPLVEPTLLVDTETFQCSELLSCKHFRVEKLSFSAPFEVPMNKKTFHALFISEGTVEIRWGNETLVASSGTSVLIPAALPAYTLTGKATVLRTTLPE